MDYRIRWQQQRRQRRRKRLLIIPAALLLAAVLYWLLRSIGGGAQVFWVHQGPQRLLPHFTAALSYVYVAWPDGHIEVLRATDGSSLSRGPFFSVPEAFNVAPTVAHRVLYLASDFGVLRAINAGTGQPLWKRDTQAPIRAQPLFSQGRLYAGNEDGKVYCFTPEGARLWVKQLDLGLSGDGLSGQPAVVGSLLIVATTRGVVHALDLLTGAEAWRLDLQAPLFSPVAAAPPLALVGSDDGYLYVVDATKGVLVQKYPTWGLVRSAAAANDQIIAFGSTDGWLRVISRDGRQPLWAYRLTGPVTAGPVIDEGVVYVAAPTRLVALSAESGQLLQSWRGNHLAGDLVVTAGTLYIGSLEGAVMALATPVSDHGADE